jgi:hypothetical protein
VTAVASSEATLREVIEALAPLERRAGSDGERRAAEWIARRLTDAGCPAELQEEEFHDGYARLISSLAAAGGVAGVAALVAPRARHLAGAVAAAATAAIADDISNGPRWARRALAAAKPTWNVVGSCGPQDAPRTLVVLAHHDAATAGAIFDQRAQEWFGDHFPGLLERRDTSLPLWWLVLGVPALVAAGAVRRRRGLLAAGVAASAIATATFEDIARAPLVSGANDNLTAVAVLVALAERLRERPIDDLRVLLVSCGAEEVLQGGIYGFARRYFPSLDRDRTWFVNLETVGSPNLIGMEDYHDRTFRDFLAHVAEKAGAPVRRGLRARYSTDAAVPNRAGYPTATLSSMNRYKALSNYHRMTDVPENVDYRTVRQALVVTEALARELAASLWIGY